VRLTKEGVSEKEGSQITDDSNDSQKNTLVQSHKSETIRYNKAVYTCQEILHSDTNLKSRSLVH